MSETPSFAAQMLAKLQALLLANPGADTINVDGTMVKYADLIARYEYFSRQVEAETGKRPLAASLNLESSF